MTSKWGYRIEKDVGNIAVVSNKLIFSEILVIEVGIGELVIAGTEYVEGIVRNTVEVIG